MSAMGGKTTHDAHSSNPTHQLPLVGARLLRPATKITIIKQVLFP